MKIDPITDKKQTILQVLLQALNAVTNYRKGRRLEIDIDFELVPEGIGYGWHLSGYVIGGCGNKLYCTLDYQSRKALTKYLKNT